MTQRSLLRSVLQAGATAALLGLGLAPPASAQRASSCGTDAETQAEVLGVVRSILASPNPEPLFAGLTPDAAELVSDPRVCARAAQRINWLSEDNQKNRLVYVVRVGLIWAVHDPGFLLGEWSPLVLFDTHWKVLKTLLAM